jgi:hypothetical protein
MKPFFFFILLTPLLTPTLYGQGSAATDKQHQDIRSLIDTYSQAREKKDTVLLKSILTADVDQLVSSGEWRNGIQGSMNGMMRSSQNNPGTRKLIVEKIRFFNKKSAIVDARYEIQTEQPEKCGVLLLWWWIKTNGK